MIITTRFNFEKVIYFANAAQLIILYLFQTHSDCRPTQNLSGFFRLLGYFAA
jgi:hypothetical protein